MLVSGLFYPFLCMLSLVSAQFPNCTKANTAFCETPVFGVTPNNIIFRCPYDQGQASPANCNDDLASVPPIGLKYSSCWESSPTAGDAQCTYECVAVTLPNGTSFYPLNLISGLQSNHSSTHEWGTSQYVAIIREFPDGGIGDGVGCDAKSEPFWGGG
ncbi:hypothetical protein DL95DRAFT_496016 [Leptodontidium sp. 2 PMI_412]|nr:hypothetical protein DL95DRAFT_496016 [Leptodontidium sp. 2 PMI_412]